MKMYRIFIIIALALSLTAPELADAKGGFGGGRSFGGSRSYSRSYSRPSTPSRSYSRGTTPSYSRSKSPSFGGTRTSRSDYSAKYGAPRRTQAYSGTNGAGLSQNYRLYDYGGYSSGLMMGYLNGTVASHMMWLPWYGAFWYTQPYYSDPDADGVVEVYPPTFNYTKLIIMIIIVGLIVFFIYSRLRRSRYSPGDESQSSFG